MYQQMVIDEVIVCEARTGEKLDSQEMRKRKAKEVQEFDEFDVKMKFSRRRLE